MNRSKKFMTAKGRWRRMPAKLLAIYKEMCKVYGRPIGSGSYRHVFLDGDTVIKVPRGYNQANQRELDRDERSCPRRHQARCWKDDALSAKYGVLIIRMERVEPIGVGTHDIPTWAASVDTNQIGYNADGRLVCYDYAD